MPTSPDTASLDAAPAEGHTAVLHLRGKLDAYSIGALWKTARATLAAQPSQPIVIDAADVTYVDGAGNAFLADLLRQPRPDGAEVTLRGLPENFAHALDRFDVKALVPPPAPPPAKTNVTEKVGHVAADFLRDGADRIAFVGESSVAIAYTATHPARIRWRDVLAVCTASGADAVPIVLLIGTLMGIILAFQAAVAMGQFGAEIYVANLVALSVLRELGPLMTAILYAGRSGSAFAAEIGTMKVNEEIDALVTMGLDPVRFLVVPRLIAGVLMCPLLTLLADLAGLIGGALVMRSFNIPFITYIQQVESAASQGDLLGGLGKSIVFGLLVAGIGCLHGLRTGQGPSAVGLSTTRAVVGGIILIVVADGTFAVIFHMLDL